MASPCGSLYECIYTFILIVPNMLKETDKQVYIQPSIYFFISSVLPFLTSINIF